MNYAEIKMPDIANGPGCRVSLFVSGCTHHCPGCFNQVTWDFNYGSPFTQETEDELIEHLKVPYIQGLTLLGGEPFEHENQKCLLPFLKRVKKEVPNKSIWAFSGYVIEDMLEGKMKEWPETKEILSMIDVLVDGEFKEELKDITLEFKGSSNQRTIDVQETLKRGEIVLVDVSLFKM
jgi:anaerobic ribonucleoside-triphosphate reductase activating protein